MVIALKQMTMATPSSAIIVLPDFALNVEQKLAEMVLIAMGAELSPFMMT